MLLRAASKRAFCVSRSRGAVKTAGLPFQGAGVPSRSDHVHISDVMSIPPEHAYARRSRQGLSIRCFFSDRGGQPCRGSGGHMACSLAECSSRSLIVWHMIASVGTSRRLYTANSSLDRARADLETQNAPLMPPYNMSEGLCMFDGDRRLLVSNARYARMYGLRRNS